MKLDRRSSLSLEFTRLSVSILLPACAALPGCGGGGGAEPPSASSQAITPSATTNIVAASNSASSTPSQPASVAEGSASSSALASTTSTDAAASAITHTATNSGATTTKQTPLNTATANANADPSAATINTSTLTLSTATQRPGTAMPAQSPEVGPTTSALASPAVNTIAAQAGASVRPTSIVSEFDPAKSLATQLLDYECYGATKNVNTIPTAGIGAAIAENATNPGLRLGFERAPNSQRSSYVFRVAHNDPITQGGARCELAFTKSPRGDLPKGTTFWYVTNLWIDDWTKAKDDQLVTQFHDRDFSLGLSPYFAVYVKGEQARVTVRWEASNGPTTATSARVTKDIWTGPFNFSRRWVTLVVKTLVSTKTTDNPFISVWLDGKHLATYRGPLGYNQPTLKDYAKVGYYHWTTNNPWDSAIPVRTMYVGNTAVISDPANEYTEPLIREYSWASQ